MGNVLMKAEIVAALKRLSEGKKFALNSAHFNSVNDILDAMTKNEESSESQINTIFTSYSIYLDDKGFYVFEPK